MKWNTKNNETEQAVHIYLIFTYVQYIYSESNVI